MVLANKSKAKNKIIILDSCYSGVAGNPADGDGGAQLKEGTTILTASTKDQRAMTTPDGSAGVFTELLIDALDGSAANLLGDITPGSVYAHIDQSLGSWAQRPVFKTNVKTFVSLRRAKPPISLADLRALAVYFPTPGYDFELDPSYEPERTLQIEPGTAPPDPGKLRFLRPYRGM